MVARCDDVNLARALYISGAGPAAPPAERAPLLPARARSGTRHRAARSFCDPRVPVPGVRPLLSPSRPA
ncbi:hypothetical protein NDU88_003261 [Pleurodeles waltl]|uniref:Uncharacterized protein n=1 Tax=Pleurodeles waltl TaxID=8319 RepID=A0AAV7NP74_PLEWA|nr:hypothetical protein NDU88_003261 [Pleurodeles waltl]